MGLKEVFKDVLLEKSWLDVEALPRTTEIRTPIPGKAVALIGVRRCGKSTLLQQAAESIGNAESIVYVNFSDERLLGLKANELGLILEAHYELYPRVSEKDRIHFFLDEIQLVENWEFFADRLIRNKRWQVFLSGSSSKLLSTEIASVMRGRAVTVELFPFSFAEILRIDKIESERITPRIRSILRTRLREYLNAGGFPEVVHMPARQRMQILQGYYDTMLLKDVIERYEPAHPLAVRYASTTLINQCGSLYTVNKLLGRIKSFGFKMDKSELSALPNWLEDAFVLFSVPIFAESFSRQTVNPRKVYCVDTGLVSAVSASASKNTGHLLENFVFLCLRRQKRKIRYFRDRYHHEVDFVTETEKGRLSLIQVTESLRDDATRKREVMGLRSAMAEIGLREATVVSLEESEDIKVPEGKLSVIPAWRFAIDAG